MTEKLLALVSLAALVGFLGILAGFVPEADLIIVAVIAAAMAGYDFYLTLFHDRTHDG